jgi:hypothetical protein
VVFLSSLKRGILYQTLVHIGKVFLQKHLLH